MPGGEVVAAVAVTLSQLRDIAPHTPERVVPHLNLAMQEHGITTPLRQAAFLAQCAHESNQFRELREEANGEAYEGRLDLGNTVKGDGRRFPGRGCIQITGRENYTRVSGALGVDFVAHPEWLEKPEYAFRASAWWWQQQHLNEKADDGDFTGITRVVNGRRMLGLAERQAFYSRALTTLGAVAACSTCALT